MANLSKTLMDKVARFFPDEDGEPDLESAVAYACKRKEALARHGKKVSAVKDAIREGKAIPKGVTFKRYVPAFTAAKLDAAGTPREIATWAHKAPEATEATPAPVKAKAPRVRKASKPAAPKAAPVASEVK